MTPLNTKHCYVSNAAALGAKANYHTTYQTIHTRRHLAMGPSLQYGLRPIMLNYNRESGIVVNLKGVGIKGGPPP